MSEYNAYGEFYDQRPELIIADRLKHLGSIREMVQIAKENNFRVDFSRGPLRRDMVIRWNDGPAPVEESYNLVSGLRYLKKISGENN